jgi:hypothetical protein
MFRDDGLARAMEAQSQPTVTSALAALYRDVDVVISLLYAGLIVDGSLCIGILVVEDAPVLLRHQEHDAVRIPPGLYYVGRQREFGAGEAYRVSD